METKQCAKCKQVLSLSNFYRDGHNKDKYRTYCKECISENNKKRPARTHLESRKIRLKREYGLTLENYTKLLCQQKGVCAICGEPETIIRKNKLSCLTVDHCHGTNKIRGLLCHRCNSALGLMRDNPSILRTAADYLEREED